MPDTCQIINRMRRKALSHAPWNVLGVFTSTSSRNCKQTGDLKRGIRGRTSCLPCSCEPAKQNSSPLVSLLDKRVFKFKVRIFKREICYFVNFKISFTRKNWLLKFGFANRLAQILEPKLLAHEILKFAWFVCFNKANLQIWKLYSLALAGC